MDMKGNISTAFVYINVKHIYILPETEPSYNVTVTMQNATIELKGYDVETSDLIYYIVKLPSQGTLYQASGAVITSINQTIGNGTNVTVLYELRSLKAELVDFFSYMTWYGGFSGPTTVSIYYIPSTPSTTAISSTVGARSNVIAIAVSVAVIGALLIALILIAIFLIIRRRNSGQLKLKAPDFKAIAFKSDSTLQLSVDTESTAVKEIEKDLLNSWLTFVMPIAAIVTPKNSEVFCKSLVYFYLYHDHQTLLSVMKTFLTMEIKRSNADTAGSLFRENSFTNKMFVIFAKVIGLKYLWDTLALPVNELVRKHDEENKERQSSNTKSIMSASLELERNDLEAAELDEQDLAANTYLLLLTLTNMFSRICKSEAQIPKSFIEFFRHVFNETQNKFGVEAAYKAIGQFLFLRFLSPPLSAPHIYGLLSEPPSGGSQRILVLITKMIQHLANETLPGKKQHHLAKLDEFVTNNIGTLHNFYDRVLRGIPERTDNDPDVKVPQVTYENAIGWIHNFIYENQSKLISSDQPLQFNFKSMEGPFPLVH